MLLFDHPHQTELDRLRALGAVCDAWTIQLLERIVVQPGWHCLDIGAAVGRIAEWLAEQVGPAGEVVAADIDTTFLDPLVSPTLIVRKHDVTSDPVTLIGEQVLGYTVEPRRFHLVHARFLLEWLPKWKLALDYILASVKPGGAILLSDIAWQRPAAGLRTPRATSRSLSRRHAAAWHMGRGLRTRAA
jgi:ubiquinone/menaquinone biosynthesis C-methylase UbiE